MQIGKSNRASSPPIAREGQPKRGRRRFAIIGAGPAGICAAKYLLGAGFDVTVFEIGSKIGGLWCYENDNGQSSAYSTLHINTPKSITRFSDLPFPDEVQEFPDHVEMYNYMVRYAETFGVDKHIRFRTRVVSARPAEPFDPRAPQWIVTTEDGGTEIFDRLIVASGHLSSPRNVPEYQDNFTGEYVHTHHYRSPDRLVGQRVCIIGTGNSACDVASDICMTAARTVIVARSGVIIAPKLVFGKPYHDVKMWLERAWIPRRLRVRIEALLVFMIQGSMTDLGFRKPDKRVHGTSNAFLVQHIRYRRVIVKQGIERIEGKKIVFTDGSSDEFDVLLAATGYNVELPFLGDDILPVRNNSVDLYKRIVSLAWPGLYFVGLINSNTSLMQVFEEQMRWILSFEAGEAMLPSPDEMRADIEARKNALLRTFRDTPRHTLEEPYQDYFPALKRSLAEAKKRAQSRGSDKAELSPFENYSCPAGISKF